MKDPALAAGVHLAQLPMLYRPRMEPCLDHSSKTPLDTRIESWIMLFATAMEAVPVAMSKMKRKRAPKSILQ
jgi:hypothetical protein